MKVRLKIVIVLLVSFLLTINMAYAESCSPEQMKLIKWMTYFYVNKDYQSVPDKLVSFSDAGLFGTNRINYALLGFVTQVFKDKPEIILDCLLAAKKLPKRHKSMLIMTVLMSDRDNAKVLVEKLQLKKNRNNKEGMPFSLNKLPDFDKFPDIYHAGRYMDAQWGKFMASGEKEPVKKIVEFLKYAQYVGLKEKYIRENRKPSSREEKEKLNKSLIYNTAMWSIKSNAQQHPLVKKYCEELFRDDSLDGMVMLSLGLILNRVKSEEYKQYKKALDESMIRTNDSPNAVQ